MRVAPERTIDSDDFPSRSQLVCIAFVEIVALLVVIVSFWAAYVWPVLIVVLASVSCIAGLVHYRSASDAKYNNCCCSSESVSRSLVIYSAVVLALCIVGVGTSIIAAVYYRSTSRVFAIICAIALLSLAVAQCFKILFLRRLQLEFRTWEMTRAAHSVTIAPISHVVSGQPIITSSHVGYNLPTAYPGALTPEYPVVGYSPRDEPHDVPPFVSNVQPYNVGELV